MKFLHERGGMLLWFLSVSVVLTLALLKPQSHSVLPAYEYGTAMFLSGGPLYDIDSAMGYLYTPAFAALYTPFYMLGSEFGGLLWRLIGVCCLTAAVLRQANLFDRSNASAIVSLTFAIAIPMALGAIRNGQSTVLLTAACWFLTLDAFKNNRSSTVIWTYVALIAKPTAIVMVLLVAALRPRMIPFLALAIIFVFATPYAFEHYSYVNDQHVAFFRLLTAMGTGSSGTFEAADFTAPFAALSASLPVDMAMGVRVVAAGLVLVFSLWFDRRNERHIGAFAVFLLAVFYMTVFNPRVESNTYVMLAVPAAFAISIIRDANPGWSLSTALGTAVFLVGLTGIDRGVHEALDPWFKPLIMTLVTTVLLHSLSWRSRHRLCSQTGQVGRVPVDRSA
ncbi:hypothetical protein CYK37_00015 [Mesorhizobium loti]|nr:hypothetical protein CYK37_00015 [Mesorhizobium loti]